MTHLLKAILFGAAVIALSQNAMASETRPEHFKGEEMSSWTQARTTLNDANAELLTLLAKSQLSLRDSGRIHELSYSMENALQYMRKTIAQTEIKLEELHLASEATDLKITRKLAESYVEAVSRINLQNE